MSSVCTTCGSKKCKNGACAASNPNTAIAPETRVVVNIDDRIVAFCAQERFKEFVRKAINDEFFWRDMLQRYHIASTVDAEIRNKVPTAVQTEVNRLAPTTVQHVTNNYVLNTFPGQVNRELNNQIPIYLNNSPHMQQILANHAAQLNSQLTSTATNALEQVVQDPQHHTLSQAHLAVIDQQVNTKLEEVATKVNQQVANNATEFNNQMTTINKRVESDLQNLSGSLNRLAETTTTVGKLKDEIKALKAQNTTLGWWITGIGMTLAGTVLLKIYALNK